MNDDTANLPNSLRFGRCELRLDTREVHLAGMRQRVRRRVFDFMVYLVQQRPRVVTHGELMRKVWQRGDLSQTLLARAVMEARRACGDPSGEPGFFVSVHGVGYRFAGALEGDSGAAAPAADAAGAIDSAADAVRAMVRDARRAVFEHRFEQARAMAQQALAQAQSIGVRSEQVRALLVWSLEALHGKRMAEAARLANQALQIAQTEGIPPLVAEARSALGGLHALAGDRETGIRHLREAMEIFSAPGQEANLRNCLNWLARAMRDQGELEASLQLCRRGIALQVPGQSAARPILDRLNEVQLLTELGDQEAEIGHPARAQAWYEAARDSARAVLPDLESPANGVLRASALGMLAVALERLGRLDEACAAAADCDAQRAALTDGRRWPDAENMALFRMQRARLLARTGQLDEALADVRDTLATATQESDIEALADLYRLAGDIAQRAGLHEQAATWLRARCEAQAKAQRNRGATLAAILAAEMNADAWQRELADTRLQLRDVLAENAELHRRVHQLEGALPLAPDTGLAPAAMAHQLFEPMLQRARERELPLCLGMLWLDAPPPPAAGRTPLHRAAEVLRSHPDITHPPVALGPAAVVFQVRDSGPQRARVVCGELLDRLAADEPWSPATTASPRWRCEVVEATRLPDTRACLDWLLARCAGAGVPEPGGAAVG